MTVVRCPHDIHSKLRPESRSRSIALVGSGHVTLHTLQIQPFGAAIVIKSHIDPPDSNPTRFNRLTGSSAGVFPQPGRVRGRREDRTCPV